MNIDALTARLAELPLTQYAFIKTEDLLFTDRVRHICRTECPMYGKSWACPPAVGTVDECRERCMRFERALLISTAAEVSDIADLRETLATLAPHEEITRQVHALVKAQSEETLALSAEACTHCERCTYPDAPCRFPQRMYPCIEGHGILVTVLAERYGIDFTIGNNVITWFSLIFYR